MAPEGPRESDERTFGRASEACPSWARPIDLVHLDRQTAGDESLRRELLGLMARQLSLASARLDQSDALARRQVAHMIRGAALGVGAFPLAASAEGLERAVESADALTAFRRELARAADFIRSIEDS